MSTSNTAADCHLSVAEVIGAAASTVPPATNADPLSTTAADVDGLELRRGLTHTSISRSTIGVKDGLAPIIPSLSRLSHKSQDEEAELPPPPQLSQARLWVLMATITWAMMVTSAGSQCLNIALPTISVDLDISEANLQWIASGFSLSNGCFLLLSGRLADVHGRKLVLITGLLWFASWHLIGGFMKNGPALIVTRALAGAGSAMMTPSAIGVIAANFSGRSRATAFACFSAGAPIGAALGLICGGIVTEYAPTTWRGGLWILAALAYTVALASYFILPTDLVTTTDRRIDWVGAALVTVGLIFIQFAISDATSAPSGWVTPYILVLLILGFVFCIAFFFWERYIASHTTRPPLMRLQLWTRGGGRLAAVYFIGFATWMGFQSLFYNGTLYYQKAQNLSPLGGMLRFIPTSVSGVLCNVLVALLISSVPTQWIICCGTLATGIANVLFATASAEVSYWKNAFNAMWLCVLGADFLVSTGSVFVAAFAEGEEQSVAGAVFNTMLQLGGAFGLSLTTVISEAYRKKAVARGASEAASILSGLHAAFWLGAGFAFAALILAVVSLRGMGKFGSKSKTEQAPAAATEEAPLPQLFDKSREDQSV